MRAILRLCVVVALLVTVLPSPLTQAQGTAVFSRIDVAGNERIEADTVRVFSGIEPGEPVSPEDLNLAVRRLFDTGLFEDVTVMPQAGRLVITVVENPTINQIAFEGNNSIDDEELTNVVELRPRLAYSVAAAEADAQRIVEAYRQSGRFSASVNPVIIRQSDNRVDLVFEIFEGRSTQVQRVSFTGNEAFSDRRLRRVIETNQANWLSFLFGGTNYDADRLELDRELLRQFYLQRGYVDFRVLSSTAELSRERNGFFLSFTVSEGAQYRFGQIGVASAIPGLDATAFEPLLGPVLGNGVYNVKNVDTVIERITFQAGQQGYAFVDIRPIVDKDEANRIVNITFEMTPGERVFVERIDITGNTRTLDRVIRRQFDIVEGDAFNAREIRDAEDQIRGLGYFSTATVSVREGTTPDRALVLVEVEEQSTGSLNLGGAYSTNEGLTAQIGITERNFLGRGQTVSATIAANKEFGNFEFGFVEPALFDRDLLAGFSLYYRQRDFSEQTFQQSNAGFEPRIGYPLSENGRIVWRYRLSQDDIYNLADNTSRIIFAEEGSLITSAVGATYAYDRRNSVVDPTAGFIMTLNQEFAGLGGDVTHSKTRGTARVYSSLFDEQVVLSAELEGGAIFSDQGTRITDRFNAGGDSFRGFARNGLGPRDECDVGQCLAPQQDLEVDESLGGNYYGILRLDASFPLGLPEEYGIYGGVFGDVGSLWGLDDTDGSMGQVDASMHLRSAVGVSLFVDTPFAPLRFNYAVPIKKVDTDVVERFRFSIESRF
ncbi:MAG TPA: outer membrane protein assembly factor BamA [Amaricoccus sp.]|uniref:outer membrane protein assembly factor BamA n=1 Tax=Amaricoccus sp. TaxID=1872485 RepID=UPI002C1A58C9|nr:outer membrane protein assembly factor BamA [Amaricoccus sp.]HMQ91758.1 outer membrane protein assembly factor BamA [Amaricoccus sp.]HMR51378.1 outer membrane protein assembly factor BamA [Amaricoccus sp.]HMR60408.1 outer membrane protein assembly factor BamA [Amaricoccus sp.]HMT98178.1 outer membrane protein assembly factor BamA [Amaricoccus sp.]